MESSEALLVSYADELSSRAASFSPFARPSVAAGAFPGACEWATICFPARAAWIRAGREGGHAIAAKRAKQPQEAPQSKWVRQDADVRLMLAFQSGQEDAFRQLVQRNQSKVYGMVYRLVGDRARAEDLTQEVFLRVFRTAARYRPLAKFSTWMYRIAANVALNAIRAERKRKMAGLEMPEGEDGSSWQRDVPDVRSAPPHADLDAAELLAKLNEAVAALPENQRIAITLNKFEHMSYQQIADILDVSTMAVKSLLARARCNLRDAMARYLGAEFATKTTNPSQPPRV